MQRMIFAVQTAIDKYRADRRALFGLFNNIPKGWKFQVKRDPAEGDPSIPPRLFHHRTTGAIKIGGKTFRGIATIDAPETYAPPQAVELIGPDGNRPTPKTPEDDLEYKLLILLRQMLENVKQLTLGLLWMEREPAKRGITADASALSRLYQALPYFPYWPYDRKIGEGAETILSEEKPLLDDAMLALRRMAIEDERNQAADSPGKGADGKRDHTGFASAGELADQWGLPRDATRKKLDRWRENNPTSKGYTENVNRARHEPQYLYDPKAVGFILDKAKTGQK